jgi:hypothetical protein
MPVRMFGRTVERSSREMLSLTKYVTGMPRTPPPPVERPSVRRGVSVMLLAYKPKGVMEYDH